MFKHELFHFFTSLAVGVVFSMIFNTPVLLMISFLFGFFIDADHLFDYLFWAKRKFIISEFFKPPLYVQGSKKVFVLLHGWEYLIPIFLIGITIDGIIGIEGLGQAAFASYLAHLLWDQISVVPKPFGYFLSYRLINKFKMDAFNS